MHVGVSLFLKVCGVCLSVASLSRPALGVSKGDNVSWLTYNELYKSTIEFSHGISQLGILSGFLSISMVNSCRRHSPCGFRFWIEMAYIAVSVLPTRSDCGKLVPMT